MQRPPRGRMTWPMSDDRKVRAMSATPPAVALERPCNGVAVVRLNRPERLNAIDEVMRAELGRMLGDLVGDRSARAVVLTGTGRGFCAGIDVRNFGPSV